MFITSHYTTFTVTDGKIMKVNHWNNFMQLSHAFEGMLNSRYSFALDEYSVDIYLHNMHLSWLYCALSEFLGEGEGVPVRGFVFSELTLIRTYDAAGLFL